MGALGVPVTEVTAVHPLVLPAVLGGFLLLAAIALLMMCMDDGDKNKSKRPQEFSTIPGANENNNPRQKNASTTQVPLSNQQPYTGTSPRPSVGNVSLSGSYLRTPVAIQPEATLSRPQRTDQGPQGKLSFDAVAVLKDIIKDKRTLNALCINEQRMEVQDVIGRGAFGLVFKGVLLDRKLSNPHEVAIKTVQGEKCEKKDVELFLKEVLRMRNFHHPNVMSMLAMVIKDNKPHVILPFMHKGDLKEFIANPSRNFSVEDLVRLGLQVAEGMKYLASNGFVHRDLAARNCMVDKNNVVRVADFGLSRDLYDADYYLMKDLNTPLPIRWMSLESIFEQKFSEKTDVWSFGILLWELLTRGRKPYPGIKDNSQVVAYIREGKRMKCPEYVAENVNHLMLQCWAARPQDRPRFDIICGRITKILQGGSDDDDYLRPTSARNPRR